LFCCECQVLQTCEDFANEPSVLQDDIQKRGHICRFSPKCHPEIAGHGIEYCWGLSKRYFRKQNSELGRTKCTAKNLEERVRASLRLVPLSSVLAFARKTRRYRWAYQQTETVLESFSDIEKLVKTHKSHRNVLDQFKKLFDDILRAVPAPIPTLPTDHAETLPMEVLS
jgi:hypothetical protein